jgi:2-oxoisovalerate dehydrogenase E1 component beta subunit
MVPTGDYELALHKANIIKEGKDITLIGWGNIVHTLKKVNF